MTSPRPDEAAPDSADPSPAPGGAIPRARPPGAPAVLRGTAPVPQATPPPVPGSAPEPGTPAPVPGTPPPAPPAAPPPVPPPPQVPVPAAARATAPVVARAIVAAPAAPAVVAAPAAPAVVAAPAASAVAAPAAVPPPPLATTTGQRGPLPGTGYDGGAPPGDDRHPDGRRFRSGRLTRLHIGSHTATHAALARLRLPTPGTGLVAGIDRYQRPVPVPFFRAEPTRISLVGGVGTGQLLAFRALALGTRVAVVTDQPGAWDGFGERAVGLADRVAVFGSERPLTVTATVQRPALIIHDLGAGGATKPPLLGPWQTLLTILRRLDPAGVPSVQECHLVMLQRLTEPEATTAGRALRLSGQQVQLLQVMTDDMLALLGGGVDQYVWLARTELEDQYATAPRR